MVRSPSKSHALSRTTTTSRARKSSTFSKSSSSSGVRKTRSIRAGTCNNCRCPQGYTNLWRSDRGGARGKGSNEDRPMLCNACGLWLSEKGYHRPQEQWRWRTVALKDAEAKREAAIKGGADPASVPIEMFLPDTYAAPVMPIASVRRLSTAADSVHRLQPTSPVTHAAMPPASPTSSPVLHAKRLEAAPRPPRVRTTPRHRPSSIMTKRLAPTTKFPAGPIDLDLDSNHVNLAPAITAPHGEEDHERTAASALMGLCSKAWEITTRSPSLPPTPTSPISWRLLDSDMPSPSWIDRRSRRPPVVPPPAGFHLPGPVMARTLSYDLPFETLSTTTPSLPIPQRSGFRGFPASYFDGGSLSDSSRGSGYKDSRLSNDQYYSQSSSPPTAYAPGPSSFPGRAVRNGRTSHRPTALPSRRDSAVSFSSVASSVLLTPPAETIAFAEPFAISSAPVTAFGKLSLGPSLENDYSREFDQQQYHPSCHPSYHQSRAQAYQAEYQHFQQQQQHLQQAQFGEESKLRQPQPSRRYQSLSTTGQPRRR